MDANFRHRLQQAITRTRRHQGVQSGLILLAFKEADPAQILDDIVPVIRFEDNAFALEAGRVAVILEDLHHIADPLRVAHRLKKLFAQLEPKIAVVNPLERFETAEVVFKEALEALKRFKGKPVCSDKVVGAEAEERLKLEQDLAKAVDAGKLVTYYQPIFNLRQGTLTGFEALVRWEHPKKGLLLPGAFLEIADLRGHLLKIDEIVLRQALTQINVWNKDSDRPIYVSANLSSDHFLKNENLNSLMETLNTKPRALNLLRIDVSEQVLFDQNGIDSLNTLDMLRIGFNLDDFGVDSESFHCLGSFPFNSLKIDRTLIEQMEDEVNAELIVAVLRIAKRMGMKTIAEGVVTHAQLEELRNLGCTEAQGFLFSEAVPVDEATEMITAEYRW